ncbi:MFS transporter [Paracoccus aminophilus]|uniref:Major facilitator superfamily transport protein n=1 Tax=Paracoccus aminophilus JCM 7686 TaxID=1367847 RepID=S5Z0J7_PARAH|nr:MFS transporter [Paracoccus aminophilus]AGT10986.1 major facilitator superfamily transport protein [Paracoccus aminophilus JCM 7686]
MTQDEPAAGQRLKTWTVLICAATIVTIAMGIRQAFGLFLRPIELDLGITREAFGLAIALQNLVLGLAQPVIGAISDKHGAGRVAAIGGVLYALGLVLAAGISSAFGLTLSLGVLVGFAMTGTTFVVAIGAATRAVAPEKRGMAAGVVTAGGSFGQFLLVPVAQALLDSYGWRETFVIYAALAALMALLAIGIAGRPQSPAQSGSGPVQSFGAALREALSHSGFWLLNLGFFVCGFHVAFIGTHLPAFLADKGLDPAVGARALALIGLFNILGSYVFGMMADRLRKKYVLGAIYLARALVMVVFLSLQITALSATVFACVLGFLWLGTVPLTSGLVAQIFGVRYVSTLFGIVFLSHQVGAFFGAWGAGYAYRVTGSYDFAWQASIGIALLAAVIHWPINDRPMARLGAAVR